MKNLLKIMNNVSLFKFDLKMKLSALFMFTIAFALQANESYSQKTKITLELEEVTVEKVINFIENSTEYRFMYLLNDVNLNRTVTVQVKNQTVDLILDTIFEGTSTTYKIDDRQIFLVKRKKPIVQPEEAALENILQERTITGTVTDTAGQPLLGVNVIVKGTTTGAATDFDGNYKLTLPDDAETLVFSYVGFETKEVVIGNSTQINAVLSEGFGLSEIVIMARKRRENLQDVPVAVTALQGVALKQRDMTDVSQLSNIAPNVTLRPTASLSGASNASAFFIRGIGQTDFAVTTDPGVGTYIDGVYVARSVGGVLEALDLESVEVLRGPQGTLFGRNTIGGAVNVRTKRPTGILGGEIRLTTGAYGRLDVAGAFNLPVTDNLKFRFSGLSQNRDGYVKRLITDPALQTSSNIVGKEQGNDNSATFRGSMLFDPSNKFEILTTFDYTRVREQSVASTAAISSGGLPPTGVLDTLNIPGLGDVVPGDPRLIPDNIDETYATGPNETTLDIFGFATTITWDWTDNTTFKSITAVRRTDGTFNRDGDGTPFPIGEQTRTIDYDQFSQEFQLNGSSFDSKLNWTTGIFYFSEQASDLVNIALGNLLPPPGIAIDNFVDNSTFAVFGQGTVKLSDKLNFTSGLRWTNDKKEYKTTQILAGLPADINLVVDGTENLDFSAVTGRASFDYKWKEGLLTYISASRGFKSGGFTPRYVAPVEAPLAFDPETVWSYEIGNKWQTKDNRLRLNVAAFTSSYTDIQLVLFDNFGAPINQNGGEATISGLELEGSYVFNKYLSLSSAFGYSDANFDSVLEPGEALPFQPVTVDSKFPNTPTFTSSLSPRFTLGGEKGKFVTSLDWFYSDGVHQTFENDPELFQGAHHLLDGSMAYSSKKGNWTITGGVHNLTDNRIILSGGIGRVPGFGDRNFNPPRQWYVAFDINF